ncbi:MAG: winged helix-turn-helix domain-containing protein [Eggerthellaceae bacterium]|nr:winged helix-turn-helix domain-containing protein [Eggerthellaceae bacterium]
MSRRCCGWHDEGVGHSFTQGCYPSVTFPCTNLELRSLEFAKLKTSHSCCTLRLRDAWGWEYLTETKTVETNIKRLRNKLEASGHDPRLVETVRGYGYRWKKVE